MTSFYHNLKKLWDVNLQVHETTYFREVEVARKHICLPGHQPDPIEFQKLQSVEKHISKCSDARRISDLISVFSKVESAIACGADSSPQNHIKHDGSMKNEGDE